MTTKRFRKLMQAIGIERNDFNLLLERRRHMISMGDGCRSNALDFWVFMMGLKGTGRRIERTIADMYLKEGVSAGMVIKELSEYRSNAFDKAPWIKEG